MPPSRAVQPVVRAAFVVERYAVYDEFAAGGMATVHFARLNGAHGFRRTVAVKRLLPHLTRDRDFALMLVDEARLAARVRHHNVVSTLDVVQTSDELLLVMDYVHGESLAKLAHWSSERGERIPLAIALAIVIDALHGLHAAHEAKDERGLPLGLVHRDVSPQNILIGLDGITRIADFGVAKAAGRAHTTRDGAVKGKLAYMAPEQLGGGEVSRTSDVFAAATVLWEVLTAERLFAGANHAETVFKVMSAPISPPSARHPALPAALDAVVMRGLERDPTRRYATARELALALERCAPSIRPSEIASWIEHVVGDRLSSRASTLSAIERSEEIDTQAHTLRHLREPSGATAGAHEAPDGETGTRRRESGSAGDPKELAPSVLLDAASASRQQTRRTIGRALALVLLTLAIALAWLARSQLSSRAGPVVAAPTVLPTPGFAPKIQPREPASSTLVPITSSLDIVDAAVGAQPRTRGGEANEKRRTRPARKDATGACDPPYTIDSAGRVLFKIQCM